MYHRIERVIMYRGTPKTQNPLRSVFFFYLHSCFFSPLPPLSFHFFMILSNSHHMQYRKQIYLNISFLPYIFVCIGKKKEKVTLCLLIRSPHLSDHARKSPYDDKVLANDRQSFLPLPTYAIDEKNPPPHFF
jgi:hypothetical protein